MGDVEPAVNWLLREWRVIASAPVTFTVALVVSWIAMWKFISWIHSHIIENLKATDKNQESTITLLREQLDTVTTEADNLRTELVEKENAPSQLVPVMFGNSAVKDAYVHVTSAPSEVQTFTVNPEQVQKLAAYFRLQEIGLAKIERQEGRTVVSGTSAAKDLRPDYERFLREHADKSSQQASQSPEGPKYGR